MYASIKLAALAALLSIALAAPVPHSGGRSQHNLYMCICVTYQQSSPVTDDKRSPEPENEAAMVTLYPYGTDSKPLNARDSESAPSMVTLYPYGTDSKPLNARDSESALSMVTLYPYGTDSKPLNSKREEAAREEIMQLYNYGTDSQPI
jgi:hypothetical protein